jgi:hypothetical protein
VCRCDSDQRVRGVSDVAGPEHLHSLDIIPQTSKAQPREAKGEGSSRDKVPKIADGRQEARPPVRITHRRELVDGHMRVEHIESAAIDCGPNRLIGAGEGR